LVISKKRAWRETAEPFSFAVSPIGPFILPRQCGEEGRDLKIGEVGVGMYRFGKNLACVFVIATVAACAPAPKPLPAPPPPKPVVVVPPPPPVMPLPPGGAASSTKLPAYGADGVRVTPNRNLSREEAIWNFRAAINVAALNCQGPVWGVTAQNYNQMLVAHKTRLAQANTAVDNEYRKRFPGQNALRVRDTRSTELYNYFAFPPVREEYCNTSLRKVQESLAVPATAFPEYAIGALGDIDSIYLRFYDAYAQYERDIAAWNLKYGVQPATAVTTPAPAPTTR
jgi:hypothetical protein